MGRDFALEFYTFLADNYAPYYTMPVECTDRDAPFVLDGLLYNETDLDLKSTTPIRTAILRLISLLSIY
jgi:TnpA family transposase